MILDSQEDEPSLFQVGKETPSSAIKTQSTPGKGVTSINLDFANSNDLILPIEVDEN